MLGSVLSVELKLSWGKPRNVPERCEDTYMSATQHSGSAHCCALVKCECLGTHMSVCFSLERGSDSDT